jgi:hypothetical protein
MALEYLTIHMEKSNSKYTANNEKAKTIKFLEENVRKNHLGVRQIFLKVKHKKWDNIINILNLKFKMSALMRGGKTKENGGGGEFNYDIFDML